MRMSVAARSMLSRMTGSSPAAIASARVVGIPSASSASLARNSRTVERTTARPSPKRENAVRPAPLI